MSALRDAARLVEGPTRLAGEALPGAPEAVDPLEHRAAQEAPAGSAPAGP